ncbi:MAG: PKD domain-containing protein, partial [Chitinophagales bacterium]|nr:PKD domain-containing protein [Chitinophagales bacterium]
MRNLYLFACIFLSGMPLIAGTAKTGDLQFIQNLGQWQNNIQYTAPVYGGKLFLENNCFTWYFSNIAEITSHTHEKDQHPELKVYRSHAFKTNFVDANENVQLSGLDKFTNYYNYFIGSDEQKWRGNVPAFQGVLYDNIYDNIQMKVYSSNGNMKYDFISEPGADVSKIKLQYEGLKEIKIINGNLHLVTSINEIIEMKPIAWQQLSEEKVLVPCEFRLEGNTVSFYFPEGYNTNAQLIIDPATLIFASYTGSTADNWGYSATYDDDGNLYGAGIVMDDGYPVTTGAFEEDFQGGEGFYPCDVGISKFTSDGTDLVYSTYLGGGGSELPHSLIVDSANQLIVYGTTGSDDFPTGPAAFDDTFNGGDFEQVTYVIQFSEGSDIFLTKFAADGGSIIGSTYFGGSGKDGLNLHTTSYNYGDHARGEVVVDVFGNSYIASCTESSDIPTTTGVVQEDFGGEQDGVIAKFNDDLSDLIWCTYIGGSENDGAYSLKKASDGQFLVCGGTASDDFPTLPSALNPDYLGGSVDGWVAKLNSDASSFVGSTYIGTDEYDQTFFVDVDAENNVYITGQTSGDYPVTGGVYSNAGSSQFITKLNADVSEIIYSTVFGTGSSIVNMAPSAFLVDNCQNVYVSGWGGGTNVSFANSAASNELGIVYELGYVTGMPTTGDAYQSTTDGSDYYFIVFERDAEALIYASFFGGSTTSEHVDGGTSRFDKKGRIYQAVCAGCGGSDAFPTTDGAYSETNNSFNCNLGVIKFEFTFGQLNLEVTATPDYQGCVPFTV